MKIDEYNCELCGTKEFELVANYKFINEIFKNKQIVECKQCTVKSIYPTIKEKQLEDYNKNYYLNAHKDLKLDKLAEAFFNSIAKCIVNFLEKYLKKKKLNIKNVLEIGPGKGHFYDHFIKSNDNVNYSILESDLNLKEKFRKKNIKVYDEFNDISENHFDLIIFSHVLEHIINPNDFLKKINNFLKKNGVIFFEVPCLDYLYKDIVEPHVFFYDKKSLSILLTKNNFTHHQIFYYGKKISDMQSKPLNKQFKYKFLTFLLKLNITFLINLKEENKYNFLNNKYEKIVADMYEMNSENEQPSWWMRALVIKN